MTNWRSRELILLIAATPAILLIFALSIANCGNPITVSTFAVPLGLFAAFLAAHFAICKLAPSADNAMLPIVYMLSGIGIAFVMRLAPELATAQLVWLLLGVVLMVLTMIFVKSISSLCRYKYTIVIGGLILLVLPMAIGTEYYGSRIWLSIAGFSFQPGEIAKILIVLFLAAYLAENREMLSVSSRRIGSFEMPNLRTLVPLLLMWAISLLIVVFERDLGSALLFFGVFLVMLYIATGRISYILIAIALLGIGVIGLYYAFPHFQSRVAIWLDPFAYAQDAGYQLVQALYSMADGGFFGDGIGKGMPTSIPVVESDFIFAALAEETGLLGASAVIIGYIIFCVRGFIAASRAKEDVGAFAASGLTVSISFQAFVIIGGVTGLIPLTGVTLPFMSQGGSSLISSFIILGLLLRISDTGTGVQQELTSTNVGFDGGVLGRVSLGKRLTRALSVFALLFAVLIGNITYIMVVHADELQAMPSNNHTLAAEAKIERGSILTSDEVVLAESVLNDDGTYSREYPQGSLAAHVVGYYSQQYGTAGIEAEMNTTLTGNKHFTTIMGAIRSLAGGSNPGNDVVLTIDSRIQKSAEDVLKGNKGAVVVLDPSTGAILAMASSPTYDIADVKKLLNDSKSDALFNRATMGLYAPGSTFKTVTLAAALEDELVTLSTKIAAPGKIEIGGGSITNSGKKNLGNITVEQALALSSNVAFAQIGDQLGAQRLVQAADSFGFDATFETDFSMTKSLMPDPNEMTKWENAWAAVGQPVGEHPSPAGPQATVIQMAMIAAAFANDGVMMTPYLVSTVYSPEGKVVEETFPKIYLTPVTPQTAANVTQAMAAVVKSGTGTAAKIPGATVVGKTGTAQTDERSDDSWFIGTATANGKSVTIAIVIEDTSTAVTGKAATVLKVALEATGAL